MPRRTLPAAAVLLSLAASLAAAVSPAPACDPAAPFVLIEPVELPDGIALFAHGETVVVANGSRKPIRLTARNGSTISLARGASRPLLPAWWRAGGGHKSFVLTQDARDAQVLLRVRPRMHDAGCGAFLDRQISGAAGGAERLAGLSPRGTAAELDAQRTGAVIAAGVTLLGSAIFGAFVLIRRRVGRREGAHATRSR
jgi:hypothetical protein